MLLKNLLLVFLGGGIGCVGRYGLTLLLAKWEFYYHHFPLHTLLANVFGCLLIGILIEILIHSPNEQMRLLFVVGLCGGFTTFSTFSLDFITLFKAGNPQMALCYMFITLIVCVGMTLLGMLVSHAFIK